MPESERTAPKWTPREIEAWAPPADLSVSEWAEKYRVLGPMSQEPGPLRLRRTPYLVPILNCVLDRNVEEVVFCKSAQIAGTEAMLSIVGYYAHMEPCPIMIILADQDTATHINKTRIQPMFTASKDLAPLLLDGPRTTKEELELRNGTYICMGWASSVARLASRPIRIVVLDEVDKPGYYVESKEADPISLARQRTETFFDKRILMLSTPTTEDGNIWKALNSCDVIYDWHVPCPKCGTFQPLRWSNTDCADFKDGSYLDERGERKPLGCVVWSGGRDATPEQIEAAGYQCGSCGGVWTTVEKNRAVEKGKMVPRTPVDGSPRRIGFHINRLYSLLGDSGSIPRLVSAWITSQDDPGKRQDFINGALAEPWRQVVVSTNVTQVLEAKCDLPPRTVPEDAVALTAGVDVQKNGFWFVVRAWARDMTRWLIDYGYLPTWSDVERLLFATSYPIAGMSGHDMRIWRACIDTGGGDAGGDVSLTETTYWWLRENSRGRGCVCFGTKGSSKPLASTFHLSAVKDRSPSGKAMPGGLRIVLIDTDKMKDAHFYALDQAREAQRRGAYLHSEVGDDYARQILAEEKRTVKRGVHQWVQVKKDNHLLDCEVMALACAHPEWPAGGGVTLLRDRVGVVPSGSLETLMPSRPQRKDASVPDDTGPRNWWESRRTMRPVNRRPDDWFTLRRHRYV